MKKVWFFLNIHKATTSTSPFSPRGNLSELLNRIVLDVLRNVAVGTICSIENLTFGEMPWCDILNFYSGTSSIFKTKQQYLKTLVQLQTSLNEIRISHIEGQKYKAESTKVTNYYTKIIPGAIVSISNPDVRRKKWGTINC